MHVYRRYTIECCRLCLISASALLVCVCCPSRSPCMPYFIQLQDALHVLSCMGHCSSLSGSQVPAYFDDDQREATQLAGRLAGLETTKLIRCILLAGRNISLRLYPTASCRTGSTRRNDRQKGICFSDILESAADINHGTRFLCWRHPSLSAGQRQ